MKKNTKIILGIIILLAVITILAVWKISVKEPVYPKINSARPFKGSSDAKVVLTEYSDFQCPFCKNAASLVNDLAGRYQDKIKIEFKYFPLTSIHINAFNAALAAECANDQGKFWEMHDEIFKNQTNINASDLKSYAGRVGLKTDSFNACLDSKAKADVINADMRKGDSLGVQGTPTFFLNGAEVDNPSNLDALIVKALQQDFSY